MAKGGCKKKNKNLFKVAGSRTLKAKNKAKPVTTHLKQLNQATNTKTEEINKMLSELQGPVRQSQSNQVQKKPDSHINRLPDKQKTVEQFDKTKKDSDFILNHLDRISF